MMIVSRLLVLFGLFHLTSSQNTTVQQQQECTRTLSNPLFIDAGSSVTLEQSKNTDTGLFTMRLTYTGGHSWIGIGVNLDGRAKMTPTQAIIGRMDGGSSVAKYRLASDDEDASGVLQLSDDLQADLYNTSFVQVLDDDDEEVSILEFTMPLADNADAVVVTDESFWVFGVGLPDNVWVGKHNIYGGFQLALTDNCLISEEEDGSAQDGEGDGGAATDPTNGTGGITIIDTETQGETLYLIHGICMGIAWGIMAPLAIGASFVRQFSWLSQKAMWLKVHLYMNLMVLLLTVVGFILAVVATGQNSDVKDHFKENPHTKIGLSIFILVFVQCFFGYYRPSPPKATPAKLVDAAETNDDGVPKATSVDATNLTTGIDTSMSLRGSMMSVEVADVAGKRNSGSSNTSEENDSSNNKKQQDSSDSQLPKKTWVRAIWEKGHRLLGLAVIAMSWYNCSSGIVLHAEEFGEDFNDDGTAITEPWIAVFWGITGGITGVILIMGFVFRCRS